MKTNIGELEEFFIAVEPIIMTNAVGEIYRYRHIFNWKTTPYNEMFWEKYFEKMIEGELIMHAERDVPPVYNAYVARKFILYVLGIMEGCKLQKKFKILDSYLRELYLKNDAEILYYL